MRDSAKREAASAAAPIAGVRIPTEALKEAGIAFLVALALFGSLIGLKTEAAEGGLQISTHFDKAIALAALVAVGRFLLDVFVWRRSGDGQSLATLFPAARFLARAAAAAGLLAGLALFAVPGLRASLISSAGASFWLFGTLVDLLSFACVSAFVVVAAILLVRLVRMALAAFRGDIGGISERLISKFSEDFPAALLLIALVLPLLAAGPSQRYAIDTATQILIYVMLGWGLNVVVGLAGLLDLGYVAFYAVGAYTYALIATQFGWSFWACLPLSGLFAALWGITLGFPVLRLRGDYLAIVTLAFGEIIRIVLLNWQSVTGGPNGVNRIPKLTFFGLPFDKAAQPSFHGFFGLEFSPVYRIAFLYYVILALALLTNYVTLRLRRLPIGRAWEALREDEIACRSVGINTVVTKLTAFAIGATFGGLAGAFFSARQGFISPESFTFNESALVLAIVVLGGLGSQLGVVIAAVVLVGSSERFRELQDYRMLIFGLSMVLVMLWRPRGLMAGRTPSAFLHEARFISASHVKEGRG
jgi:branched-chain amino acid transport system permease protein